VWTGGPGSGLGPERRGSGVGRGGCRGAPRRALILNLKGPGLAESGIRVIIMTAGGTRNGRWLRLTRSLSLARGARRASHGVESVT
jgi:hypothetical protein